MTTPEADVDGEVDSFGLSPGEYEESTDDETIRWRSKPFQYPKLNLDGPAFRLLRLRKGTGLHISCRLFKTWLDLKDRFGRDRQISYEALSYTWGGPEFFRFIEVNGQRLRITKNLYSALHHLRLPDRDRIIWADAVCIDQQNLAERGHQVAIMTRIYKQADGVIFWLDESSEDTDAVFRALGELRSQGEPKGCRDWQYHDSRWLSLWASISENIDSREAIYHGMRILMGRQWFRRAWILQEVANARAALVCCGRNSV